MANCEGCGIEISGKYKYCFECNKKHQEITKSVDIANELSHINNNLYYIRRALAVILEKNFDCKIMWDKEKKDFEVIEL